MGASIKIICSGIIVISNSKAQAKVKFVIGIEIHLLKSGISFSRKAVNSLRTPGANGKSAGTELHIRLNGRARKSHTAEYICTVKIHTRVNLRSEEHTSELQSRG